MFKNTAATFRVFAFDSATGLPKSGDASNITAYVSKDYGAPTVLGDTSATEEDATNAKGYYTFTAAQAETNADCLMISGKSSTSGIVVVGAPAVIYTRPQTGWLAPTTAGRTLDVSAGGEAGIDWANVGSPTTTVDLSGTTIAITQKVDVNTIKTQTVTCSGSVTIPSGTLVTTTYLPTNFASLVINLSGSVDADVHRWDGTVVPDLTTNGFLACDLVQIADAVWDEVLSGHLTSGTTGAALNSSGSAADPLLNAVPGSYAGGTAGYALGQLGSGSITFTGPVIDEENTFEVIQGDDYLIVDSRSFNFTFGASPNLTSSTVVMRIQTPTILELTGTKTGEGTSAQVVKFEMTKTQTAAMQVKNYAYDIQATLSDLSVVTLARSTFLVRSQVT